MRKRARNFTLEFKKKAVELSHARGNAKAVAEELNIYPSLLYRWRKELTNYGDNSFPGRGKPKLTEEQKEIANLKKQLKDVKLERDILKKAICIFSESDRKNLGS